MDPQALATEMEEALRCHVIDAWFPRSLDRTHGGFQSNFDREWRPFGRDQRMLEFQARQTRAAARLATFYPDRGDLAEYALHGFRYLRDVMWDRNGGGGWFWLTEPDGTPAAAGTKHGHATSYAVQACALVFKATGEPAALELAEEAFEWFDRRAHDNEHGGYHGWLQRDGTIIRSAANVPAGAGSEDPLGHEVGLKDVNVHGDWFEALLEFEDVTTTAAVGERREELGRLYLEQMTQPGGRVDYLFRPDWKPWPSEERYGYGFQATHRLWSASRGPGGTPAFARRAEAILLHTVRRSAVRGGGFAFEGPHGTGRPGPGDGLNRSREWWVQVEALRALTAGRNSDAKYGAAYGRMVERQWRFIQREVLDDQQGGVFATARADRRLRGLLPLRRYRWRLHKGDVWKDASHETDALVACIRALGDGDVAS